MAINFNNLVNKFKSDFDNTSGTLTNRTPSVAPRMELSSRLSTTVTPIAVKPKVSLGSNVDSFMRGVRETYGIPNIGRNIKDVISGKRNLAKEVTNINPEIQKLKGLDISSNIKAPIPRFIASIPESTANVGVDLLKGGSQAITDITTGDIRKPKVLLSDIAKVASPVVNLVTAGSTGPISKGIKSVPRAGFWDAVKEGALEGGKFGAGFGLLGGLESGRDIESNLGYTGNVLGNTAMGGIVGSAFGAGLSAILKGPEAYTFMRKVDKIKPTDLVLVGKKDGYSQRMRASELVNIAKAIPSGGVIDDEVKLARRFLAKHPEYRVADMKFKYDALPKEVKEGGFINVSGKKIGEIKPLPETDISSKINELKSMQVDAKSVADQKFNQNIDREIVKLKATGTRPLPQTKLPIEGTTSEYNVARIKTKNPQLVKQALDDVAPAFKKLVGESLSHDEIIKRSEAVSDEIVKTIGRAKTEELGAAQLRIRRNIAQLADEGKVTPELLANLKADASFARSTAQLLGQRAIDAEPNSIAGKNMVKYIKEVSKIADDIASVYAKAKGVDFNNPEQAATFYREFIKPTAGDWVDRIRYSSMLSSPNTFINNFSSNLQGTGLLAPVEKTITGVYDAMASAITGKQRTAFAGEGVEFAKGYASKLSESLKSFSDAMKGGSKQQEMFDVPLTKAGTAGRNVENALAFFPRLQQATDELFSTLTRGGLERTEKYRVAKGGIAKTTKQLDLETKRRLFNQPFGSDQSYLLNAIEFIPTKVMEATQSKNPYIKWTSKFIFPFVRIPTNVFKAGIEYSPLGISTLPGAGNKMEQLSKATMGSAVALGAWSLAQADRLTFAEPTSEKQRDAFKAAGLQPYSVKIGDKWINYTKLHPMIGFNMALASAVKEQSDRQTISDDQYDTVMGVASKWLTYFANQSYVKQMGDFMSLAKGNESAIGNFLTNSPQQLIPYRAFMGWLARAFDPYERKIDPDGSKLDKSLQSIMMSIPGMRNQLMPRVDSQGQPIAQQNRFLNLVAPAKVTNEVPAEKEKYVAMRQKNIDTAKEKAFKEKVKVGGMSDQVYRDKYYYNDDDGTTKSISLKFDAKLPKMTGSYELDRENLIDFKGEVTGRINDVVKLYNAGAIDQNKAESQIKALKKLQSLLTKATAKPKKPKKIKVGTKSTAKIKLGRIRQAATKLPKVKITTKVPKFKPKASRV